MEELIKRLERVIQTGAPDEDGMHPISAEVVLEVVKGLYEHGTNLAEVGTDCISREQAIDAVRMVIGDNRSISVCDAIKQLPPIQPKRGRWIPVTNGRSGHECDQCHNYAPSYQTGEEHLSDFCPSCGADMREVTT